MIGPFELIKVDILSRRRHTRAWVIMHVFECQCKGSFYFSMHFSLFLKKHSQGVFEFLTIDKITVKLKEA